MTRRWLLVPVVLRTRWRLREYLFWMWQIDRLSVCHLLHGLLIVDAFMVADALLKPRKFDFDHRIHIDLDRLFDAPGQSYSSVNELDGRRPVFFRNIIYGYCRLIGCVVRQPLLSQRISPLAWYFQ